jgi:T5orf172 domain
MTPTAGELATVDEVAAFLRVPPGWVNGKVSANAIPHLTVLGRVCFHWPTIHRWVDSEPTKEVGAEVCKQVAEDVATTELGAVEGGALIRSPGVFDARAFLRAMRMPEDEWKIRELTDLATVWGGEPARAGREFQRLVFSGSGLYCVTTDRAMKIGIARDIKRRLSGLQTATAERLELEGFADFDWLDSEGLGARECEKWLHSWLYKHRQHGEWFEIVDEVVEAFQAHEYDQDHEQFEEGFGQRHVRWKCHQCRHPSVDLRTLLAKASGDEVEHECQSCPCFVCRVNRGEFPADSLLSVREKREFEAFRRSIRRSTGRKRHMRTTARALREEQRGTERTPG